jgi:YidC/Oxa1 family membrane protein insertase
MIALRQLLLLVASAISLFAGVSPMAVASPLQSGEVRLEVVVPGDAAATLELQRIIDAAIAVSSIDPTAVARIDLDLKSPATLRLVATADFAPPPLPGLGAMYGEVRAVVVNEDGQHLPEAGAAELTADDWVAVRSRFHAVALSGVAGIAEVTLDTENEPVVTLRPDAGRLELRLYAGPIEAVALRAVDPVLTRMLFAALWDWLRWLCFGMLWLLTTIDALLMGAGAGHIGWSIVLLSLSVKILMLPLTKYADALQASVNRTQALLQPQLAGIKREFKGEAAHERVLAVYKEHGVSPLYTFKSLIGFLIQIPIFIAAFDMLGENVALAGQSFLWVEDLARPDAWLALPVTLPFFGGYLNLLPLLMTGITLLTSRIQRDPHLTPDLHRAQQLRLYLMAGAFFLLFYTFPAGMVLYWTTNNVLHLGKIILIPPKSNHS